LIFFLEEFVIVDALSIPFNDGRSFALYLKGLARDRGITMKQVHDHGIIDKSLYSRYFYNLREPKVSTASAIVRRFCQLSPT
jgi:hypothetical protein